MNGLDVLKQSILRMVALMTVAILIYQCNKDSKIQNQLEIHDIALVTSNVECFGKQPWTNLECFDAYRVQGVLDETLSLDFHLNVWKPNHNFSYAVTHIESMIEKSFTDLIEKLFIHYRLNSWDDLNRVEMSVVEMKINQSTSHLVDEEFKIANGFDFVSMSFNDREKTLYWLLYENGRFNLQKSFEATEIANE